MLVKDKLAAHVRGAAKMTKKLSVVMRYLRQFFFINK
jgi:hypothetical protein